MTRSPQVPGGTRHAGQESCEQPPRGRLARLFEAADRRHVPLRTILVTVGVVVATYLAGKLMYLLRDIVLLMLVAGFVAMLLNPAVAKVQRRVPRRGVAVTIVTLWAALVFIGLAAAFGVPLVNGITHLADRMPSYIASAQHGRGWIGHLVTKYHIQAWVQRNTPKLVGYAQSLSKPALSVGKGAVSLIIELFTIFVLVLLLLLEGPTMWNWTLGQMTPGRKATVTRIAADVSQKVTGYMFGNLLTSLIAGIVVFVTLLILGVPFPLLWGLWVALVDFLPMIGGALAGIPTVLFAFIARGLTAGIVTAAVFAGLHPDREPRPEPGGHEQDGADQPAARIHRGAGRRLDRQPDRRHIRRFRRGAAGHPDSRRAAGAGQGGLAGHRPGPAQGITSSMIRTGGRGGMMRPCSWWSPCRARSGHSR